MPTRLVVPFTTYSDNRKKRTLMYQCNIRVNQKLYVIPAQFGYSTRTFFNYFPKYKWGSTFSFQDYIFFKNTHFDILIRRFSFFCQDQKGNVYRNICHYVLWISSALSVNGNAKGRVLLPDRVECYRAWDALTELSWNYNAFISIAFCFLFHNKKPRRNKYLHVSMNGWEAW